jgi:hypothetical protein
VIIAKSKNILNDVFQHLLLLTLSENHYCLRY